ncbi:Rv1733c family protein [Streptomyces griseorubiginosus]|uniref:Rv1733c family protein n=1 Tax=Streptomyces griseorubiginosus TaxID=67304 RepID=UPI003656572F
MAGTRRAHVKRKLLWRWRRNPLRRRSDRVETWIVLTTWIVALAGGLLAGRAAGSAMVGDLATRRAAVHAVSAVLTEDSDAAPAVTEDGIGGTVHAKVRWTASDGSVHTGLTRIEPGRARGSPVTVWIDRQGDLVRAPLTADQAGFQSALTGVLVAVGTGAAVFGCGRLARIPLERRRMRDWETEWARVAPSGGRT